jgi:RNase P/RNase MRP subunit POP5
MVRPYRKRYIVFHVLEPAGIGLGLLISMLRESTKELDAEIYDLIKPWFVYYHEGWGIIRCRMEGCGTLVGILESMGKNGLREGPLRLRVVGNSGTLRTAFFKHIPEKAREGSHYRRSENT